MMKRIHMTLLCCAMVFFFFGCSSAIYFYETEKVSITLEGRPDAAQPVSANIGVKQRAALVAPPKSDNSKSLVSKFDLLVKDEPDSWWDSLTIDSILLTGSAATKMEGENANRAFTKSAQ